MVTENPESLYEQLSKVIPKKEDEDLEELEDIDRLGITSQDSLAKSMKVSPKLSDMQTADKRLFPDVIIKDVVVDWLGEIQIARVFPDTYVPYRNMIAKHILQNYEEVELVQAFSIADRVLSVAIDGEGRIDELALIGKAQDLKTEENKVI